MNRCKMLTNRETYILQFLAERFSYGEIAERLKTSVASIHTHVSNIRKKTKIVDLKNAQTCKVYLDTFAVGKRAPGPTEQQKLILKLYYVQHKSTVQITHKLSLASGTVTNALCQGRKRIPFELSRMREKAGQQLQEWFASEGKKPFSPMDDDMF